MRGPVVIETDLYVSAEACARSILTNSLSGRILQKIP
jgi:hypothetical protein